MICRYCKQEIQGGKGDYWHTTTGDSGGYGTMKCADGEHLAAPMTELDFVLHTFPDEPMEWYFFSDKGEHHTTHTTHEFFKFAHTHRSWGYTNVVPKAIDLEIEAIQEDLSRLSAEIDQAINDKDTP